MKLFHFLILGTLIFFTPAWAEVLVDTSQSEIQKAIRARLNDFRSQEAMPQELLQKIQSSTWRSGCPVQPSELKLVQILHWNYDEQIVQGQLLVHRDVAEDVLAIFTELFEKGFMIEKMRPIEFYRGDDERSMRANNTSAFNCRDLTGQPGVFSVHSYGRAIDINPVTNPYVKRGKVSPAEAAEFQDRSKAHKGSILKDGVAVEIFKRHGWKWGGDWRTPLDYQHFEKHD